MSKIKSIVIGVGVLCCVACDYFQPTAEKPALARVNESFLYVDELVKNMPKNLSEEDSAVYVNTYINRWATEQLLMDQAKLNLPLKQQENFEQLVQDYRKELYTEAYKDMIIARQLDTTMNEQEIRDYFEANRSNFKLNEALVKLRYIQVAENFPNLRKIKTRFLRFNDEDRDYFEKEYLKFKSISLNDSIWVSARNIYKEIRPLQKDDEETILQPGNFLQLQDSTSVYLLKVKDVLLRNEKAPLVYARPTVKQILLNRRKLELAKKLEKEITKDAIKTKKFEIYN